MLAAPKSVLIVDDHPVYRLGVRFLLDGQSDFAVVGEAGDTRTALDLCRSLQPDLLVLDLMLQDGRGLELLALLPEAASNARVLVVSMLDEVLYAERCLRAGAKGYLMKSEAPRNLVGALRQVSTGAVYLGEKASQQLFRRMAGGGEALADPIDQLTDRELEVFQLIADGHSTRQIAELLHLSPKTVESHQAKLRRKLGVNSATELLRMAISWQSRQGHLEGGDPAI